MQRCAPATAPGARRPWPPWSACAVRPEALYHAAWLLNHGEMPGEAAQAHALAREAAEGGYAPARWLAAAAYDRACMYAGRPQRYGTQFVPDGVRYRLWDVDVATSDSDRAEWDVPPLAEQRARRGDDAERPAAANGRRARVAQGCGCTLADGGTGRLARSWLTWRCS